MKGLFTVASIAFISSVGVSASAQTPTTTPQTGTSRPSIQDSSKTGSPATAGANTKPGANADSTMNNGGAPGAQKNVERQNEKNKMKKDEIRK